MQETRVVLSEGLQGTNQEGTRFEPPTTDMEIDAPEDSPLKEKSLATNLQVGIQTSQDDIRTRTQSPKLYDISDSDSNIEIPPPTPFPHSMAIHVLGIIINIVY